MYNDYDENEKRNMERAEYERKMARRMERGDKAEKALLAIVCLPAWLFFKALGFAFYILGMVAEWLRFVVYIAFGLVLLGALAGTGWQTFWIFMIPIAFLFVLPYISGYLMDWCYGIADYIADRWNEPVDSYQNLDEYNYGWYDKNLTYDENYNPIFPDGNNEKDTEDQYGEKKQ